MLIDLFIITAIIVFVIDLSGVMDSIYNWLRKWLKTTKELQIKPFDCSLCMTHHILLLYLLITSQFTLINYLVVCMLSFFTPVIKDIMILTKDLAIKIIDRLYFLINKL